jgi:hypothetical protein
MKNLYILRGLRGGAFLELTPYNLEIASYIGLFSNAKKIKVIACGDSKFAFIGYLPFPLIRQRPNSARPPIFSRRLPDLSIRSVELIIEIGAETENGEEFVTAGAGYRHASRDIKLGEIFPRSAECAEGAVPLFPALESLPFFETELDNLAKIYDRMGFIIGTLGKTTLEVTDILRLTDGLTPGSYKDFMQFVQYRLLSKSLDGSLFKEAKMELVSDACAISERLWVFRKSPLDNMKRAMQDDAITEFGGWANSIPLCKLPTSLSTNSKKSNADNQLSEIQRQISSCMSDQKADLFDCIRPREKRDGVETARAFFFNDEDSISYLDAMLDDYIISSSGAFLSLDDALTKEECPKLYDAAEDRHFLKRKMSALFDKFYGTTCSSPREYGSVITKLRKDLHEWDRCVNSRSLGDWLGLSDRLDSKLFQIWKMKCGVSIKDKSDVPQFFWDMEETWIDIKLSDAEADLNAIATVVRDRTLRHMQVYLKAYVDTFSTVCRGLDLFKCMAKLYNETLAVGTIRNETVLSIIDYVKRNFRDDRDIDTLLRNTSDPVLTRLLCDALRLKGIENRLKLRHDEYCDSHGLRMYRDISRPMIKAQNRRVTPLPE